MRKISAWIIFLFFALNAQAQFSITGGSGTYTQDFNSLTAGGTWTDNTTLPNWFAQRTGSGTTYIIGNGSSNSGGLYSFGATSDPDRALGTLGSGSVGHFAYGILLQNNTGQLLNDLTIQYVGEQWRNANAAIQTASFYYKIDGSPISALDPNNNGTWVAVSSLNFDAQVVGGSVAVDGNLPANKDTVAFLLTGLNLANGEYIMLKWDDPDHAGADHGLAVDDVEISWNLGGGGSSDLVISEINYQSPYPFPGDVLEFVEITNIGVANIDLSNYVLSGDIQFTFPAGASINPGEYVLVGKDSVTLAQAGGLSAYEWTSGDLGNTLGRVILHDNNAIFQDSVRYTNAGPWPAGNSNGGGSTIELCNVFDDNDDGNNWTSSLTYFDEVTFISPVTLFGTPGTASICNPYAGPAPQVVINEISFSDAGTVDSLEFIELYNYGSSPVNLGGFYLTTGVKFTFPPVTIGANDYVVVGLDSARLNQYLNTGNALQWRVGDLANTGDTLKFYMPNGTLLDSVLFTANNPWPNGGDTASIEFCRPDVDNANGVNWNVATNIAGTYNGANYYATPGSASGCNLFESLNQLVITEISYNNPGTDSLEFVEIFNNSQDTVDLFGVTVNGNISYAFSSGDSIFPGEYIVLTQSPANMQAVFGLNNTLLWNSGNLVNTTGTVFITDGLGGMIDSVTYGNAYPWPQPANGLGWSLVLCDPNADNTQGANWTISETFFTNPNTGGKYYAHPADSCSDGGSPDLVITEILFNDPSTADTLQFIEIYNNDNAPVNVAGYSLVGVTDTLENITLQPGDYYLVARDSVIFQNFFGMAANQWDAGSISTSGEAIVLKDATGNVTDYVNLTAVAPWNQLANGQGYSLVLCDPNNDNEDFQNWGVADSVDSVGYVNSIQVFAHPDTTCTPNLVSSADLMITEIMYNSPDGADVYEFVELWNNGNTALDVTGFVFEAGSNSFTFPADTLQAGEYLILAFDAAAVQADFSNLPNGTTVWDWGTFHLGNNSDLLQIKDSSGLLVDSVSYTDVAPWPASVNGIGPDGDGTSIVLCDVNQPNELGASWSPAQSEIAGLIVSAKQMFANAGDTCSVTLIPSDTAKPEIITSVIQGCNFVVVTFNEVVTIASAEDLGNYTVVLGSATITNAALDPGQTFVTLTVSGLLPGASFTVQIDSIQDLAGNYMDTDGFVLSCPAAGTNEESFTVSVYPNPAADFIQISSSSPVQSIRLMDMLGKVVMQVAANQTSLDVSQLIPGIYQMEITTEAGKRIEKVILQ